MERLFSAHEKPFAAIRAVGIAIAKVADNQHHLGLLHRHPQSKQVLLLHLRWHHRLANEDPDASFLWVDPAVPSRRLTQVAAICRKIWRANRADGIPYAFSPPSDCFDKTTFDFLFGPTRLGLTCATFVLAVFQHAGLPLVNYESWPTGRPGDGEWQQGLAELLEKTGASPAHVAAVRTEIGSVRYRPEEVAGAAAGNIPADFSSAVHRAKQILARLNTLRSA